MKRKKKVIRQVFAFTMAAIMVFSTCFTDLGLFSGWIDISAFKQAQAKTEKKITDTTILDADYVDPVLLNYFYKITGSTSLTAKELQTKTAGMNIELPEGATLRGIGYAKDAATFDIRNAQETEIPSSTFSGCAKATEIKLPSTITSIDDSAFFGCTALQTIDLTHITSVGANAFNGCASLSQESYETLVGTTGSYKTLTKLGSNAFSGCSSLTEIKVPKISDYEKLGTGVYNACAKVENILFLDGAIPYIPASSFVGCGKDVQGSALTVQTLNGNTPENGFPKSITYIGSAAFQASTLGELDLSSCIGLTSIGENAFQSASSIETAVLPESLTTIGVNAFNAAFSLFAGVEIILPVNLTEMGAGAFANSYLTAATMKCMKLETIPIEAFSGCVLLSRFTIDTPANSQLNIIDDKAFANTILSNTDFLTGLTRLTTIGAHAFAACYTILDTQSKDDFGKLNGEIIGLTSVTIPDCVTTLGDGAFSDNHALTEVTIGDGVTELPTECFASITTFQTNTWKTNVPSKLETVTLPKTLETIGAKAFYGDYMLTTMSYHTGTVVEDEIHFPATLTAVGNYAFSGCAFYGYNVTKKTSVHYGMTTVIFPDNVTEMGTYVFSGCNHLESVQLPANLTSIPAYTFNACGVQDKLVTDDFIYYGLQSVTFPKDVTTVGEYAFNQCYAFNLGQDNLPSSLVEIQKNAFYECKSLKKIIIPSKLKSIGNSAFEKCSDTSNLAVSYYDVNSDAYKTYTLADVISGSGLTELNFAYATSLETIGTNAFATTAITQFSIGGAEKLTAIPNSAFSGCTQLVSVNAYLSGEAYQNANISPITKFGANCFKDCYRLTTVTIPFSAQLDKTMFSSICGGAEPLGNLTVSTQDSDQTTTVVLNSEKVLPIQCFNSTWLNTLSLQDNNRKDLTAAGGNGIISAKFVSNQIVLTGLTEGTTTIVISGTPQFDHLGQTFMPALDYKANIEVKTAPCTDAELKSDNIVVNENGSKVMYVAKTATKPYQLQACFAPAETSDVVSTSFSIPGIVSSENLGIVKPTKEGETPYVNFFITPENYGATQFTTTFGAVSDSVTINSCCSATLSFTQSTLNLTGGIESYDLNQIIKTSYSTAEQAYSSQYPDKVVYTFTKGENEYLSLDSNTGIVTPKKGVTAKETIQVQARALASGKTATMSIYVLPEVTDIELQNQNYALKVNGRLNISPKSISPSTASKILKWTTSDATVISLSDTSSGQGGKEISGEKCYVTGLKLGQATITVSSVNGVSKTFTVYVTQDGKLPNGVSVNPTPTPKPGNGGSGGAGNGGTGGNKVINTSSITLKTTYPTKVIYLAKGKSYKIATFVKPANTTNKLVWTSSNNSKVKVTNGTVKGVAKGNATVTLTAYNGNSVVKKATMKVVVLKKAVKVKSVKIKGKKKLKVGSSIQLKAVVKPKKCTATIKWTSKTKKVATVDKYGVVTGKKKGTAKIVAKAKPGKKSKIFKIKVTK